MREEHSIQVDQIFAALRKHSRVVYQQILAKAEQIDTLKKSLPFFIPFKNSSYYGIIPVLDWDHRIPSKIAIFRLYTFYSEMTFRAGEAEFKARQEQITARDMYPEFDVADFSFLTADESYEAEVDISGRIEQFHLVNNWRRDIESEIARKAVQLVRNSSDYRKLASSMPNRPSYLGDLEAVSWTPPCESSYSSWTVDVWYLLELGTSVGKGCSFLVDIHQKKVIGSREFFVRTG